MTDALEDHVGTVSIGGRTITNLCFADDFDGDEKKLVTLVKRLEETSRNYGVEISAEKTKLRTNSTNGITANIQVQGQTLATVKSFEYLGAIVTDKVLGGIA